MAILGVVVAVGFGISRHESRKREAHEKAVRDAEWATRWAAANAACDRLRAGTATAEEIERCPADMRAAIIATQLLAEQQRSRRAPAPSPARQAKEKACIEDFHRLSREAW